MSDLFNIALTLAYDGTPFHGWQCNRNNLSVEGSLRTVFEAILQHPVDLCVASRTDGGVHASGQVVNFMTTKGNLDLSRVILSANSMLPRSIAVYSARYVSLGFHATVAAKGKEYHYYLCCGKVQQPERRFYSWHCPYALDVSAMEKAASLLCGNHNFRSFCNAKKGNAYCDYERKVTALRLETLPEERVRFVICGNHFLYKMVRNLVGTLLYIGRERIAVEELPAILASQKRSAAGVTAPAHGLFLHRVLYGVGEGVL